MPFTQELPEWNATGTKPPQSKLDAGWQIGERPPSGWWNWLLNRTHLAVQELQQEAINVDQKGVANGVASLNASGKVPPSQLDISAPSDASTTVKGIVMLEDSVTSTSVTKAATPKSVKQAYDLAASAVPVSQKGVANGVATLGADGKVPAVQLDLPIPIDASTTQKGVVQLSNATDSTSETLAATPKSVKDAKDGLSTQIGILSGQTAVLDDKTNDYKTTKSSKDANGIYTTVTYRRKSDNSLYATSILSGGTSPSYTTRTLTYYEVNGTTVRKTVSFALSYDADGALVSEV